MLRDKAGAVEEQGCINVSGHFWCKVNDSRGADKYGGRCRSSALAGGTKGTTSWRTSSWFRRWIVHEDVLALDVDERVLLEIRSEDSGKKNGGNTDLSQIRRPVSVVVLIDQVRLRHERPESRVLQHFPPLEELRELLVPGVNLQLELTEGQRQASVDVRFDQSCKRVEFPALDIDFQNINMGMAWEL